MGADSMSGIMKRESILEVANAALPSKLGEDGERRGKIISIRGHG